MTNSIYKQVLEDAFDKARNSLIQDLNSDLFDWDQLIDLIIEEDSPLQNVFSQKTILQSELFAQAKKLSTVVDDIENEDREEGPEEGADIIEPLEEEAKQSSSSDDFAEFEDVE